MAQLAEPGHTNKLKSRLLLVEDHPVTRQGLALLISTQSDMEVCGEASDGPEALRLISDRSPDLVIIDISLKSGSGIELIKQIRGRSTDVRMLVASAHDESIYAERSLRAGAHGYVNKAEDPEIVLEAIRQVLRGEIYLSSRMTDRVLRDRFNSTGDPVVSPVDRLSDRELEVFRLIGEGFTTKQIAQQLHLSPKTIDTHRDHIKRKLNVNSVVELTRQAVQWTLENA